MQAQRIVYTVAGIVGMLVLMIGVVQGLRSHADWVMPLIAVLIVNLSFHSLARLDRAA